MPESVGIHRGTSILRGEGEGVEGGTMEGDDWEGGGSVWNVK